MTKTAYRRLVLELIAAPLVVAAVLAFAGWCWWLQTAHAEQENHLTKHDAELVTVDRDMSRVLAKLDEILKELRGK